jgi:emfourin
VLVTIVRGGGLAGLLRRTELDSAALPPDAVAELSRLVARLSPRPRRVEAVGTDELRYELTVEVDGTTSTVRATDQSLSEPERLLIAFVDSREERVDSLDR